MASYKKDFRATRKKTETFAQIGNECHSLYQQEQPNNICFSQASPLNIPPITTSVNGNFILHYP